MGEYGCQRGHVVCAIGDGEVASQSVACEEERDVVEARCGVGVRFWGKWQRSVAGYVQCDVQEVAAHGRVGLRGVDDDKTGGEDAAVDGGESTRALGVIITVSTDHLRGG